jgi:hypothetical protein
MIKIVTRIRFIAFIASFEQDLAGNSKNAMTPAQIGPAKKPTRTALPKGF